MIVWSQTVGTSTPNPVQRGLQITRGTTAQHAIRWRRRQEERTETNTKRKTMDKQERSALKQSSVRFPKIITLVRELNHDCLAGARTKMAYGGKRECSPHYSPDRLVCLIVNNNLHACTYASYLISNLTVTSSVTMTAQRVAMTTVCAIPPQSICFSMKRLTT